MKTTFSWIIAWSVFMLVPQATQAQLIRTLSSQDKYENKASFDAIRFSENHLIATGSSQLSCWRTGDWTETHRLFENSSWDEGIIINSATMNSGQLSFLERSREYAPMVRTVSVNGDEQSPTRLLGDQAGFRSSTSCTRSADGKVLAIRQTDDPRAIVVIDVSSQKVLAEFQAEAECMALSSDGSRLVVGRHSDDSNTIQVFDISEQKRISSSKGFAKHVDEVAITPDGLTIISAGVYGGKFGLTFWNANNLRTSPEDHLTEDEIGLAGNADFDECRGITVWPDGSMVAVSSSNTIYIIDIESRKPVAELRGMRFIDDISISADGNWLASLANNRIGIWRWKDVLKSTKSARVIKTHRPGDYRPIVRFSPDGKTLAFTCSLEDLGKNVGGGELGAVARSAADEASFDTAGERTGGPLVLLIDPQTGRLQGQLSLKSHQNLRLSKNELEELQTLHDDYFTTLEFSPDGRELLATNYGGYNFLLSWAISKRELRQVVKLPRDGADIDFQPKTNDLIVSTSYSAFRARPTGNAWRLDKVSDERAQSSCFTPDGTCFLRGLKQYSVTDFSQPLIVGPYSEDFSNVSMSRDGKFAFAYRGQELIRWNLDEGRFDYPFAFHSEASYRIRVADIAVSPSHSLIAVACSDGKIRVWSYATKDLVTTLVGHEAAVNSLSFSPDGTRLASAASDGTTRLWDFESLGQGQAVDLTAQADLPANRQFKTTNGAVVKVIFDRPASESDFRSAIKETLNRMKGSEND